MREQKKRIKTKAKGSRRELQVKKMLEAQGFLCSKSGGSLGMFDIIAIDRDCVRLIQVKSGYISAVEKERIRLLEVPPEVVKEIWIFHDYKDIKQIIY